MTKIFITYIDSASHDVLGRESLENFQEVLLPNIDKGNTVCLTKHFSGHEKKYFWFVSDIKYTDHTNIQVYLKLNDNVASYLNVLSKQQKKTPFQMLHQWNLVEVDFGYPSIIKKHTGSQGSTKRYINSVQPPEMHKRRLAIVWKVVSKNLVKVIPITSSAKSIDDKSQVSLSYESVKHLPDYNDRSIIPVALTDMVQTVSTARIIAPRQYHAQSNQIKRSSNFGHLKLHTKDKSSVREGLLNTILLKNNAFEVAQKKIQDLEEECEDLKIAKIDMLQKLQNYFGVDEQEILDILK